MFSVWQILENELSSSGHQFCCLAMRYIVDIAMQYINDSLFKCLCNHCNCNCTNFHCPITKVTFLSGLGTFIVILGVLLYNVALGVDARYTLAI